MLMAPKAPSHFKIDVVSGVPTLTASATSRSTVSIRVS